MAKFFLHNPEEYRRRRYKVPMIPAEIKKQPPSEETMAQRKRGQEFERERRIQQSNNIIRAHLETQLTDLEAELKRMRKKYGDAPDQIKKIKQLEQRMSKRNQNKVTKQELDEWKELVEARKKMAGLKVKVITIRTTLKK